MSTEAPANPSRRLFDAIGAQLVLQQHCDAPPPRLGEHEIEGIVGAGGFGLVCRARHRTLHRSVALKLFPLGEETDPGVQEALREARSLARLEHPHIVVVHGVGEGELVAATPVPCAYVEMQLIAGETLRTWAEAGRAGAEVLARLLEAGRALAYAHAEGVLHRDFKPENVMIDARGQARVIDFGLALAIEGDEGRDRVTSTGVVRGTPGYIAPEASVQKVQPASDQFAFGVAVQELLTGRHPLMEAGAEPGPHPADGAALFERLRPAIERAVQLRPDQRYPSMDALCDALESASRPPRNSPRWPWLVVAAAGVGVAAFLGAAESDPPAAPRVAAAPRETAEPPSPPAPRARPQAPQPAVAPPPKPTVAAGERFCTELADHAGTWNIGARTMWTEFSYQLGWRSEFVLDLDVGEACTLGIRAGKYAERRETDARSEPLWVETSAEAIAEPDGSWRVEFDLPFEGDSDTYGKPESYRVVAVLGREHDAPFLRAVADKRSRSGALVRSAVWEGRRGVAPTTAMIRVDALPCALACQLHCGGESSQSACRRRGCTDEADVPGDICGPNGFDFKPPLRAVAARRKLVAGESPLSAALQRGSAKRLLPQCARNATRLDGGWTVWRSDSAGASTRLQMDVRSKGCELSGEATGPEGAAVPVTGEVTPAGTWTLAPDERTAWFPASFVLVGTAEAAPAFGVDAGEPMSTLRAQRRTTR